LCAFLSVIDNEMQDVELLTAMRSEFFGFTIKELADIRIHHTSGSYYSSVSQYAADGTDQGLKEKCLTLLSVLEKYRRLSYILPLEELIWDILLETGFYISMGALPNGARRQANLRALIDKAQNYRENYNGQLYGFIGYIDSVKENKIELGQVKLLSEDDDVVKIMTIHKSKGLEFPVVILSGFSSRLNYRGEASNLAMDKELGLALSYVDFEKSYKRNTILKNMISYKYIKDAVDEEKRVLYVAMTRAEQVLAVLGSTKDYDKTVDDLKSKPTKNTNYLAMTGKSMLFRNLPVKKLSLSDIQDISEKKESDTRALIEMMDREPSQVDSEIDALMNFRYGYRDELEVKSKYSVSELNAEGTGTYRRISIPRSVSGRKNFTRAEIGTITHKVLFMLDLKRCQSEKEAYVDELLKTMVKEEILTEEETSAVDRASLITFAESEIGKRMSESSRVYREQAFNLQIPVNGVYTLAQGIIDCFFYEDDGIVLIDYKTTEKSDEEYIRNEYRKQIALYKEAIEKAKKVRVKESYLYLTNFSKLIKMDDC
ncbi:MAG: PD-(D/E)XK nuclease family protein, partial [Clostridia bacterium]|nr:PD-(D/E)XK nuclease family protein [Clostridia bacterium]